jgi:hypothetical protein
MTAVQLSEDIHILIFKKRSEIYEKYGKKFDLKDIADAAISRGIDMVEEEMGLISEQRNFCENK